MLSQIQKASERKRKMMVLGLIGAIILVFIIIKLLASEDTWVCEDGRWIKHGRPQTAMPTEICPKDIK